MQVAYTICSINYLPFAKALGDSILRNNPGFIFYIVLAEARSAEYDSAHFSPHHIISVEEIELDLLKELNERFVLFELSCALKPFVADYLLHTVHGCETLFYFDADIFVYNSLSDAEQALHKQSILLTPHLIEPAAYPVSIGAELEILRAGIFNAGFFGLAHDNTSFSFLEWWKERVRYHCFNDTANGLFVDQLWLNFVPLFFQTTCILRHPGYNFAYWNFSERRLSVRDSVLTVNENFSLVFFHFSGFDPAEKDSITKHRPELSLSENPHLKNLFTEYQNVVNRNNLFNYFSRRPTLGKENSIAFQKRVGMASLFFGKMVKGNVKPF
jgi:hypothetical protein